MAKEKRENDLGGLVGAVAASPVVAARDLAQGAQSAFGAGMDALAKIPGVHSSASPPLPSGIPTETVPSHKPSAVAQLDTAPSHAPGGSQQRPPLPVPGGPPSPAAPGGGTAGAGPDIAGRDAFLKRNPVGSVRVTMPGEASARTFSSPSALLDEVSGGTRPAIPAAGPRGFDVVSTVNGNAVFPRQQPPAVPDVRAHWGGGPSLDQMPSRGRGAGTNIFGMIDQALNPTADLGEGAARGAGNSYAASEFSNPDARTGSHLDDVARRVTDLIRSQGDFLRSRRVTEKGERGGRMISDPKGRIMHTRGNYERTEDVGGLDSMAAQLYDSALKHYQGGDVERGKMFGDLANLAAEKVRQGGATVREGMSNSSAEAVARTNSDKAAASAEVGYDRTMDAQNVKSATELAKAMLEQNGEEATPEAVSSMVQAIIEGIGKGSGRRGPAKESGGQGRPSMPSSSPSEKYTTLGEGTDPATGERALKVRVNATGRIMYQKLQ